MSKIYFLHVNWQRDVDGTQEAELRSAAPWQLTVDWVDSNTTKNMGFVVNVCTHKQLMGGTSEAFVHTERLKSSVETAVGWWLLAVTFSAQRPG